MASKKTIPNSDTKRKPLRGKAWSELKPKTKERYKKAGVSPAKYNSWRRPETRAKAKAAGIERWEFLGLPSKHKISGPSTEGEGAKTREEWSAAAFSKMEKTFGDSKRWSDEGARRWLDTPHYPRPEGPIQPPQTIERLKKIARASKQQLWDWIWQGEDDDYWDTDPMCYH